MPEERQYIVADSEVQLLLFRLMWQFSEVYGFFTLLERAGVQVIYSRSQELAILSLWERKFLPGGELDSDAERFEAEASVEGECERHFERFKAVIHSLGTELSALGPLDLGYLKTAANLEEFEPADGAPRFEWRSFESFFSGQFGGVAEDIDQLYFQQELRPPAWDAQRWAAELLPATIVALNSDFTGSTLLVRQTDQAADAVSADHSIECDTVAECVEALLKWLVDWYRKTGRDQLSHSVKTLNPDLIRRYWNWEALENSPFAMDFRERECFSLWTGFESDYCYSNAEVARLFQLQAGELEEIEAVVLRKARGFLLSQFGLND